MTAVALPLARTRRGPYGFWRVADNAGLQHAAYATAERTLCLIRWDYIMDERPDRPAECPKCARVEYMLRMRGVK